jgi:enamine deaminase RidA (YjgF/YER057c/UK114 family)
MTMQTLLPAGWPRPKGYANGVVAEGRMVFLAGQVGWNTEERIVADDLVGQLDQVLINIVALLAEARAEPGHVVRMTWFITDKKEYLDNLAAMGDVWRRHFGRHYPAMSVVVVNGLIEEGAKLEIETTAVI